VITKLALPQPPSRCWILWVSFPLKYAREH
jgi:hypothetical protein